VQTQLAGCWLIAGALVYCGCDRQENIASQVGADITGVHTNLFISGFNPRVTVPLSDNQSKVLLSLGRSFDKEGRRTQSISPLPCGIFRVGGREYSWYKQYLFMPSSKGGDVYITNELLTALTVRLRSSGKEPSDLSSNDWSRILTVLEIKESPRNEKGHPLAIQPARAPSGRRE
jgi:hypothetical protein